MINIPTKQSNSIPDYFLGNWYAKNELPELIIRPNQFIIFIPELTEVCEFNVEVESIDIPTRQVSLNGKGYFQKKLIEVEIAFQPYTFLLGIPEMIAGAIALNNDEVLMSFTYMHEKIVKARWN